MSSIKNKNAKLRAVTVSITALSLPFVWGTLIERQLFTTRRLSLEILPPNSENINILHISDLHIAPWQRRKINWIKSLFKNDIDIIVNTGDNCGHNKAIKALKKSFEGNIANIEGVYVHGSNDYYGPMPKNPFKYLQKPSRKSTKKPNLNTKELEEFFTEKLGWYNINNSAAKSIIKNINVEYIGLNDPHIGYDKPEKMLFAQKNLENAHPSKNKITIGVVHAPYQESLNNLIKAGSDIIFAGHTHGGQVRIPLIGALSTNSDLPLKQARGLSSWQSEQKKVPLHISAGAGHSIYAPIRFCCLPEASIITLKPKTSL